MKVKVYYNLHKKTFSVVSLEKENYGRVINYTDKISLENVTFKVSETGRQRVLREQKKNVHAFVVGYTSDESPSSQVEVTYNPYRYESFVTKGSNLPVFTASRATLDNRKIFAEF